MSRVIDTFIFGGELDMLGIRLKYLDPVVDNFIIVESNHTFSGLLKPYHLEQNWDRYKKWHDRILYLQIEQDPREYTFNNIDRYTPSDGAFKMEYDCRNSIMHANDLIPDDAIVLLSDVDEIWDKSAIFNNVIGMNGYPPAPVALRMSFYAYYLNNRTVSGPDVSWSGTIMCSGRDWKNNTPQSLRDRRNTLPSLGGCGWHFSWMNGLDSIKNKIKSFAHTEFNRPSILDDQLILSTIEQGRDVLQRPGIFYKLENMNVFPNDLREVLDEYKHLIKNNIL